MTLKKQEDKLKDQVRRPDPTQSVSAGPPDTEKGNPYAIKSSALDGSQKKKFPVSEFDLNPMRQLRIRVSEEDGCNFIEFALYRKDSDGHFFPSRKKIKIPLALFPEIKRALSQIEGIFAELGYSEDFETEEEQKKKSKFANRSEEEFAKILDFYKIKWLYEPLTFPISWDEEGNVLESFTPDFYLIEQDLFIELTTLKQSLVTKKNRKVKRLKEIYPHVNIKIFYGKDYRNLVKKYGIDKEWK